MPNGEMGQNDAAEKLIRLSSKVPCGRHILGKKTQKRLRTNLQEPVGAKAVQTVE